jgi:hypothetical protein
VPTSEKLRRRAERADMMGSVDEHMQEVAVLGHSLVEG